MDEVIVEFPGRGRESGERHRFRSAPVRLGRAYDNDVIVADPFVGPHQAELWHDPDRGWLLRDTGGVNPTRDRRERPLDEPTPVSSGMPIWLGNTQVRLVFPDHPIAATRPMGRTNRWARWLDRVWVALPLVLLAWLTQSYVDYLGHVHSEARVARHTMMGLTGVVAALAWSANWALVARISGQRRTRFFAHWAVASLALLALLVVTWAGEYLAFWSNSALAGEILDYMGTAAIASVAVFMALIMALGMRTSSAGVWGSGVGGVVIALAVLIQVASAPDFRETPRYVHVLKPPVPFGPPSAAAEPFDATAEAVFRSLPKVADEGDDEGSAPAGKPERADERR